MDRQFRIVKHSENLYGVEVITFKIVGCMRFPSHAWENIRFCNSLDCAKETAELFMENNEEPNKEVVWESD